MTTAFTTRQREETLEKNDNNQSILINPGLPWRPLGPLKLMLLVQLQLRLRYFTIKGCRVRGQPVQFKTEQFSQTTVRSVELSNFCYFIRKEKTLTLLFYSSALFYTKWQLRGEKNATKTPTYCVLSVHSAAKKYI